MNSPLSGREIFLDIPCEYEVIWTKIAQNISRKHQCRKKQEIMQKAKHETYATLNQLKQVNI